MRMCGIEHPSTRPDARLVIAAIAKADILKFGDFNMHGASKYLGPLFLVAALTAPVTILAARATQEDHERKRVYDKDHKDDHNWDDHENRAWGQFLTENHRESHEYAKSNKKEQSKYWNWRHSHPDRD